MNITKETIKSTLRSIMAEESEYQTFFKKALEKAGKSILLGTLRVKRMKPLKETNTN
jgi:hypothetical protein